ncbi:hypothetical protein [Acidithiobacillus sp.]|nr:hypothetical protein [Acidithiobacillus ferrivorans]
MADEPEHINGSLRTNLGNRLRQHPMAMMLLLVAMDSASTWTLIQGLMRGAINALNRYHPHALIIRRLHPDQYWLAVSAHAAFSLFLTVLLVLIMFRWVRSGYSIRKRIQ